MSEPLIVLPFRHGPFWNLSYLAACPETREAVAVDPAWDVAAMLAAAEAHNLRIATVLLTHGHDDHIRGVAEIVEATGARVIAHRDDAAEVRRRYAGSLAELDDDEHWAIGSVPARLLGTPGHTPGSISLLAGGQLFTGDTLHVGAVGRPGSEPGAVEALWDTVRGVLATLPGETLLRPGHDAGRKASATLDEERALVPALAAPTFAQFAAEIGRSSWRVLDLDGD